MTDYERGVNQASAIYQEVIKDYVAENAKLRDELRKMDQWHSAELTAALDENAKLRGLLQRTWDAFHDATAKEFNDTKNELRELGVEMDA